MGRNKGTVEDGGADVVEQVKPTAGPVDLAKRVKVEINNETEQGQPPYQAHGEVVEMSEIVAAKFVKNGWGKIVSVIALFMLLSAGAMAQGTSFQYLKKVVSNMPTTAYKLIYFDTVTNTGTNYLTSGYTQSTTPALPATWAGGTALPTAVVNPALSTTIQVNITKISGTVAGTVTLQGSLDGTNYNTATSGALAITATYTATDVASQSKSWVIVNNPYRYYRVTWTGAGTMAASMSAQVWSH
jgi:hypothetical protein